MKPVLKTIYSPDVNSLEKFQPKDPNNFSILIQAMVGPDGEEGQESFDIEICTPRYLLEKVAKQKIVICRHMMVVAEYNYNCIASAIREYLLHCEGTTWSQVAELVARLGKWEFEDYID